MALRTGAFAVADARRRGVARNRLEAADLVAPFHGVRSQVLPTETAGRARAMAPRLRSDQVFSHTTAAALMGLPLPRRMDDAPVHVTTIGTDQAIRIRGAVGHRASADRVGVAWTGGVPITDPATTFASLGTLLTVDELVVVGDALVGWIGWCSIDELLAAARRNVGARGTRTVRAALLDIRPGSGSPAESRTRLALTRNGLPEPELNHEVRTTDGRFVARVDFAYPSERVAIEYESDLHRTDTATFRKDLRRGEHLKDAGWWLVRVTSWDLDDDGVALARRIRSLLASPAPGPHDPRR